MAVEGQPDEDVSRSVGGERICIRAAIGLNYGGMHTRYSLT